jgi:hypothetical protein
MITDEQVKNVVEKQIIDPEKKGINSPNEVYYN